MRRLAAWGIFNPVPTNLVMILVLILGIGAGFMLKREIFPQFEIDRVMVAVATRTSSTPEQIDRNIIQIIQPRIQNIEGVKQINSIASESLAQIEVEVISGYDSQKVKEEIRDEVEAITTLPEEAEDPRIILMKNFERVAQLAIYGDNVTEMQMREVADFVKNDLRTQHLASRLSIDTARDMEVSIYLPVEQLQAKGLTIDQVAQQIRAFDIELTAGEIKTDRSNIVIKGEGRRVTEDKLRTIPIHFPNGEYLLLEDIVGRDGIVEGFVEDLALTEYNGKPAILISIERSENEDIIVLCDGIREYTHKTPLPYGLEMSLGLDLSLLVRDRLTLITRNGATGLVLVLLVMTLFLEWRIAFWAATGVAFSLVGSLAIMYATGGTINMLTLFGFLITTGIIVDDAIVVGESFFQNREKGMSAGDAAIEALDEVSMPVTAMMLTTVVAFVPLLFVTGTMGKFTSVIPAAVISALVLSLLESLFVLPCHLAHHCGENETLFMRAVHFLLWPIIRTTSFLQRYISRGLDWFTDHMLLPGVALCIRYRYAVSVSFFAILLFLVGLIPAGVVKAALFPRPDAELHLATIEFEKGTPLGRTEEAIRLVEGAFLETGEHYRGLHGINPVKEYYTFAGSDGEHKGRFVVQLISSEEGRKVSGQAFLDSWREKIPQIPDMLSLEFASAAAGPQARDIEIWLSSRDEEQLYQADLATRSYLQSMENVVDINSSNRPGAPTYSVVIKEEFRNLPVTERELIMTLAKTFQGDRVDTFYRGDNEVKMYVRAARKDRQTLAQFKDLMLPSGLRVGQVADIELTDDPVEVRRVNGLRTAVVGASVDRTSGGNSIEIRSQFEEEFLAQLGNKFPAVSWEPAGESKEGSESVDSMITGFIPALFVVYLILGAMFHSYTQPLIIMLAIPFGLVGAIIGHMVMGIPLNILSGFGMIALTGIAVNDSLVLIDYINVRIRGGDDLKTALMEGVRRRFRPILLTSVTTVAGLCPILFETSFQAQFLIPMVTSITFGLIFSTLLILILIPVGYLMLLDLSHFCTWVTTGRNLQREDFVRTNHLGVEEPL